MSAALAGGAATGGAAPLGSVVERLAALQNLVKRDPETYAEEFKLQVRRAAARQDGGRLWAEL
jgi:small ligand-binding sensory domain FIST